ncbi:uncharacterized protein BDZ99DRAFT_464568 [Mytilinidion resinicola]|uniref:Uncharacterized protein n=1 Tax=Mytilinidion resinicola TaxID=574789 RepID=A0A6A6YIA1_9PEZI|nr:uncharacterized protein BDZ99DRAFT_464568 [Mytilinidion resinicola]KAF2807647.1 hypothetical protein BDZ99DRAFT_464568 [Mytilinidion resinicola]
MRRKTERLYSYINSYSLTYSLTYKLTYGRDTRVDRRKGECSEAYCRTSEPIRSGKVGGV